MAQFTITIRNDALKTEVEEAYASEYANPDNLSPEALVVHHLENAIKQVLNNYREKQAVQQALESVVKETTLT
jgi:hypothetical protein